MNQPTELVLEQLEGLRAAFKNQLGQKIALIESTWNDVLQGTDTSDSMTRLHRMLHSLAGAGATYGLPEVSSSARTLEHYLQPLVERAAFPSLAEQRQIEGYLDHLKGVVAGLAESVTDRPLRLPAPAAQPGHSQQNRLLYLATDIFHDADDLSLQLNNFGYNVQRFCRPAQLENAVAKTAPAAILIDRDFTEGQSGWCETLAAIQQSHHTLLPVMYLSSHDNLQTRLQSMRAGGTGYFTKPVAISNLIDKLDQLTMQHESAGYRILIVDDQPELAAYYAAVLEQALMQTMVVTEPGIIMSALVDFEPDLILMDMYMPECTGLELAAVIRQQEAYVSIPIVYLSAETDITKQLAAMRLGGDDFLTKPIDPDHLIAAVTNRVQRLRILRSYMVRDSLTGLLNHTTMKDALAKELVRSRRLGIPFVVALIDLDHFKVVNDSYSHLTGDRVLKNLSRFLQQRLHRMNILGRYGGEEFMIILPNTTIQTGFKVLDELRANFGAILQQSDGHEFSVTLSCGIAGFPRYQDAIQLNAMADKALYLAKQLGRNQVVCLDEKM